MQGDARLDHRRGTGYSVAVPTSIHSRTLQKAAELLGGRARLCRHLQVPASALDEWIEGRSVPPQMIFLRAVDVILNETTPPESDPGDPSAPREAAGPEGASCMWY